MGSLNDKLNKTQQSKEDIKQAIQAAGGVIEDNTPLSGYDEAIAALEILDSAMKQDIDKLINSSSDYKTKLDTAVNNLSTYLNTLNSYINPSYTSGSNYLAPKLSNLNSQMYSLISNIRNRIVNNLGGSVSAYNLQAIYNALGNIDTGSDVFIDTRATRSSQYVLSVNGNVSNYNNFAFTTQGLPSFQGLSYATIITACGIKSSLWAIGRTAVNDSNFPEFEGYIKITSTSSNKITISTSISPDLADYFVWDTSLYYTVIAWND